MAHKRAEPVGVGVGRILAPERAELVAHGGKPCFRTFAQVVAQFLPSRLQQGAAHAPVAIAHRAEPAGAGAHDGSHVEALNAVVGGVRREDAPLGDGHGGAAAQLGERVGGGAVALAPRDRLDVAALLRREDSHVDRAREQRDLQKRGQLAHELLVGVGVGTAQAVVHMQDPERSERAARVQIGSQVRQRRGVGSPRHHQQHRRPRTRKPPLGDAALHAFRNPHARPSLKHNRR